MLAHRRAAKPAAPLWAGLVVALLCASLYLSSAQVLEVDGFELAPPALLAAGAELALGDAQPLDGPQRLAAAVAPDQGAPEQVVDEDLGAAADAAGVVAAAAAAAAQAPPAGDLVQGAGRSPTRNAAPFNP